LLTCSNVTIIQRSTTPIYSSDVIIDDGKDDVTAMSLAELAYVESGMFQNNMDLLKPILYKSPIWARHHAMITGQRCPPDVELTIKNDNVNNYWWQSYCDRFKIL